MSFCLKADLLRDGTVCWKFELLGSQEMTAEVEVTFVACTQNKENGGGFYDRSSLYYKVYTESISYT
jgi:hypothetical protein